MIKKILISLLLASFLANTPVKADGEEVIALLGAAGLAGLFKIIAEVISINGLTQTTPKSIGIQGGAEITSNSITGAGAIALLGLITHMCTTGKAPKLTGEKILWGATAVTSLAALVNSTANNHKIIALLKNKKAIARYRKNPKIQAILSQEKNTQRRWIFTNYLLPIAVTLGSLYCLVKRPSPLPIQITDRVSQANLEKIGFTVVFLSLLAGYISEQFRTAQLIKAASATKETSFVITKEEQEEESSSAKAREDGEDDDNDDEEDNGNSNE